MGCVSMSWGENRGAKTPPPPGGLKKLGGEESESIAEDESQLSHFLPSSSSGEYMSHVRGFLLSLVQPVCDARILFVFILFGRMSNVSFPLILKYF